MENMSGAFNVCLLARETSGFDAIRQELKGQMARYNSTKKEAQINFFHNPISRFDKAIIGCPDLSVGGVGGTADVFHDTADRIGHAVDDNGFADNLGSTVKLLGDTLTDNGLWDGGAEVGFRERFAFQERECVYLPETGTACSMSKTVPK